MRELVVVCGVLLLLPLAAAGQDNSAVPAASNPVLSAPSPPPIFPSPGENPWQLGVSFEYVRINVSGTTVSAHGFNTSLTRFLNDWVGLEADTGGAWGTTPAPSNLDTKFLFYGGGLRVALRRNWRLVPWVHGLFGGAHFSGGLLGGGNSFAYMTGGGVDIPLGTRVQWRLQGDYLGTRFFSGTQHNFQFTTGLVFTF